MIGSLRGSLLDRTGDSEVLIEVAGVGYRVAVAPATVVQLGDVGDEVFVHVHHHIREDAQVLYGFRTADERRCFEALLGAHGVGPGLAMAILSVHDPLALARVLLDDDIGALCLVPGVGKKTAARLLIELKSRLDLDGLTSSAVVTVGRSPAAGAAVPSAMTDVREALANLGYGPDEVTGALRDLGPDDDASVLLKQALQRLAVG
jgi:Holliday junction DNA helicase RuvA